MKEKRLVTVLYADLSGFTPLTSQLGAELVTEFINECFCVIDGIIHNYGGTVIRHEGDRVMAVYGFPKCQGRDSYHALLSALKIRDLIKTLRYPVGIHIGIATGEILTEGNEIYGHVIDVASRLEEASAEDEINVDKNCYEINELSFNFCELSDGIENYYKLLGEKRKSGLAEIDVPYNLRELAGQIIDTIPIKFLADLSIFASFGYQIESRFLRSLCSNYEDLINYASNADLLLGDGQNISFKRTFIRDEIYARIPKDMRREIHHKIAQKFEGNFLDKKNYGTIAHHYNLGEDDKKALFYTLRSAEYLQEIHMIDKAIADYVCALQFAEEIDKAKKFEILYEKVRLLNLCGRREEEKQDIEQLIKLSEEMNNQDWITKAFLAKGAYLLAIADFDNACFIYETLNKKKESSYTLEKLGIVYYHKDDLAKAIELLNQGMGLAKRVRDIRQEAVFLKSLGLVYGKLGDREKSLGYYEKAKKLFEKIEDDFSLAYLMGNIAEVYLVQDKYEESLNLYSRALQFAQKIGDQVFESRMLSSLGEVYLSSGDYKKALNFFNRAFEIDKRITNKKGEAAGYTNIGKIYTAMGKIEEALDFFYKALAIDEEIKNKLGIAVRLTSIAKCFIQRNQFKEAEDYLRRAIALTEGLQFNAPCEIVALSNYGLIQLKSGDAIKALRYSKDAVAKLAKLKDIGVNKAKVYYIHYQVLDYLNKNSEARKYLEKAYLDIKLRGEKINDPELKEKFYQIRENREIIEQWTRLNKLR